MKSVKILHVATMMARAGVETWLMNVLRYIDRRKFHMDFLVQTTQRQAYDVEIRELGSKIIPCLGAPRPVFFAKNFKRILQEHGPYDIVHSHIHHFSGYVLRIAKRTGIPVRIAHCHDDTSSLRARASLIRRMYLAMTERWINQHATAGLACSQGAAADLFGPSWALDPRWNILYYGIDLEGFKVITDRASVRLELGIPGDAFVVGHVGRLVDQKNHSFLIDAASEVSRYEPKMYLLLIGGGPLRPVLEHEVAKRGLGGRVVFTGVRPDVPRLMRGAMDIFVFPSLYEGLPLALVEAQASGIPCIVSDSITQEADVIKPLVRRLSLREPPSRWAQEVLATRDMQHGISQSDALATVERSPFDIRLSVKELERLYSHLLVA